MFELEGAEAEINQADIENLERELGVSLPQPYASLLLESNGGSPKFSIWESEEANLSLYLQYFYSTSGDASLFSEKNLFSELAKELLPICLEGTGACIIINCENGRVLLWDSHANYPASIVEEDLIYLAPDLPEFLNGARKP